MPISERDPWRMQYFEGAACPAEVLIPTDDGDAYAWYPRHRWIYNKLLIAESQGLPCGPHGLEPPAFPVFSKPIYNMRGMGAGGRVFASLKDYRAQQQPGYMWMQYLEGEHVSSDAAVVDGAPRWWRHAIGKGIGGGMFDHWVVLAEPRPAIEDYCGEWLCRNLAGYTGIVNFETIGARIIEAHLRLTDQWPDLYGAPWLEAVIRLYRDGVWSFDGRQRREGYSVVLFGAHGVRYRHPPQELVDELRRALGVTSIQITFHEDWTLGAHSMPPGGFRLAIVNGWSLEAGIAARERLALSFWSTQQLSPRRGGRRNGAGARPNDRPRP